MGGNDILNSNSITMKPLTNAELTSRLLKAEKALSEAMGQVHDLDNIVCGLLRTVHHLEKPVCPPQVRVKHWAFINQKS